MCVCGMKVLCNYIKINNTISTLPWPITLCAGLRECVPCRAVFFPSCSSEREGMGGEEWALMQPLLCNAGEGPDLGCSCAAS